MKRGQVSVFVVIGIIALAIILLVFFFRNSIVETIRHEPTNYQDYLGQQLDDIKREVGKCVTQETNNAIDLLIKNGGDFRRDFGYINYINITYPILCREINATQSCLFQPILISEMKDKLNKKLTQDIKKCINLKSFKNKDYVLTSGNLDVSSNILNDKIVVDIDMPIKLMKDSYIVESKNMIYSLDIPLGELIKLANDLVQIKAGGSEINPLLYNILHYNKYFIEVRKPYPDEIYVVWIIGKEKYKFYFAIEGIGRYERPGGRIR